MVFPARFPPDGRVKCNRIRRGPGTCQARAFEIRLNRIQTPGCFMGTMDSGK